MPSGGLFGTVLRLRRERRLLEGMTLFVEVISEVRRELLDRSVECRDGLVAPVAARDLLQQLRLTRADVVSEVRQEAIDLVDDDAIEVAVGRGVDLRDLDLDRHRLALALVERPHQTLAAGEGALRVRVELGAELRERLELAVLGEL